MPTTLILHFMFKEKDFKVITWVSIKYCEFSPFGDIRLPTLTLYGNQMNRMSLNMYLLPDLSNMPMTIYMFFEVCQQAQLYSRLCIIDRSNKRLLFFFKSLYMLLYWKGFVHLHMLLCRNIGEHFDSYNKVLLLNVCT